MSSIWVILQSVPTLSSRVDDCFYNFVWPTKYACLRKENSAASATCIFKDEVSGHTFDLTSLNKKEGYKIKHGNDKVYFTICNKMKNHCDPDAAACVKLSGKEGKDKYRNIGKFNSRKLSYHGGALYQAFTDGEKCVRGDAASSVDIMLTCSDREDAKPSVEYSESDYCSMTIRFPTRLACTPISTSCLIADSTTGIEHDFSKLAGFDYHVLETDGSDNVIVYYLSVCSQLSVSSCLDGSGACMRKPQVGSKEYKFLSLGKAGKPVGKNGKWTLEFTGGDSCLYGTDRRKAIIEFQCGRGVVSSDEFFSQKKKGNIAKDCCECVL